MVLNCHQCPVAQDDTLEDIPLLPVFSVNAHDCRRIPSYILLAFGLQGREACLAGCFALVCGEAGNIR